MAYGRWRVGSVCVALLGVFVACSSGDDDADSGSPTPQPTGRGETVVAQQDIGPTGGSVAGGGATIDIPPGALDANTTIVIKTLAPSAITLPSTSAAVAGAIYAFEPDTVTFAKPVTITVALDASKKPTDPNALVMLLRSPTSANAWEPRGGAFASATSIQAVTDHFSDWAPSGVATNACFTSAACAADATAGGPVGVDCRVPASGGGVHCAGTLPNYTCTCDGRTDVVFTGSSASGPSSAELSALAVACGATCPATSVPDSGGIADSSTTPVCPVAGIDASPGSCESISTPCADGHSYGVRCQSSSCVCLIDGTQTKQVTSDCGAGWDACGFPSRGPGDGGGSGGDASTGGDGSAPTPDGGGGGDASSSVTCPLAGVDASPGSCEVSTPCSDGKTYRIDCDTTGSTCGCFVDGAHVGPTVVNANCSTGWSACGFPPFVQGG